MTENKRFTVDENHQGVYAYIKDNNEYIGKRCGKKNVYYVCDLLNEQDQKLEAIEKLLDNELKKAFNNRINHDDYAEDAELAEYFKGYHCGVGDLEKKIKHILFNK